MNDTNRSTEPARMTEIDSLREIVALAIETARRKGASASEAMLGRTAGLDVNVRMGEVETIEHTRDDSLGVIVYFENRKGSASSTDFSASAVQETLEAACRIARHTAHDEYSGLADHERMAVDPPNLDLFHPWSISTDEAITIAGNLADMFHGIHEIGADVDVRGAVRTGSLLIDRMTIAGA